MKHLRSLCCLLMTLLLTAGLAAPACALSLGRGYVKTSSYQERAELRAVIADDATVYCRYYAGTPLQVVSTTGDWAYVQVGDSCGYMRQDQLANNLWETAPVTNYVVVAYNGGANVRHLPSTSTGRVLGCTPYGGALQVYGVRNDGWVQVAYNGSYGYVVANLLSPKPSFYGNGDVAGLRPGESVNGGMITPSTSTTSPTVRAVMYVANPDPLDRLNLRSGPAKTTVSLGKYYNGTSVEVTGDITGGWVPVTIGHASGYMSINYLSETPVADARPWLQVVSGNGARLRSGPS